MKIKSLAILEYQSQRLEELDKVAVKIGFPPSVVQPGLDMSVSRILELYSQGNCPSIAHVGSYDDLRNDDSDFDFAEFEDEFEVYSYLEDVKSALKSKTKSKPSKAAKSETDVGGENASIPTSEPGKEP